MLMIQRITSFINIPKFTRAISALGALKPSINSTKTYRRVGRGPSSTKGKTSGRGQKGQKARGTVHPWFEGGQTPIYKRFPKIGFTNVHSKSLVPVNLERIMWFHKKGRLDLKEGEVLNMKKMKDIGIITGNVKHGVKILARGQFGFDLPIKVEASAASARAIRSIENAGGSFIARYFTELGLKAHLNPEWFLKKRGRLPLPARPTKRKHIEFYSSEENRGYLVMENDPFYQKLQESRKSGVRGTVKRIQKKGELEKQLDVVEGSAAFTPVPNGSVIMSAQKFVDLQQ